MGNAPSRLRSPIRGNHSVPSGAATECGSGSRCAIPVLQHRSVAVVREALCSAARIGRATRTHAQGCSWIMKKPSRPGSTRRCSLESLEDRMLMSATTTKAPPPPPPPPPPALVAESINGSGVNASHPTWARPAPTCCGPRAALRRRHLDAQRRHASLGAADQQSGRRKRRDPRRARRERFHLGLGTVHRPRPRPHSGQWRGAEHPGTRGRHAIRHQRHADDPFGPSRRPIRPPAPARATRSTR